MKTPEEKSESVDRLWLIRFGFGAIAFSVMLFFETFESADIPIAAYGIVAGLMIGDSLNEVLKVLGGRVSK